ncbi:MAG: hypothetical protein KF688_00635 [Pirellulales bacterium]|nr:hypothetical protein [Pirellulales bacterium]
MPELPVLKSLALWLVAATVAAQPAGWQTPLSAPGAAAPAADGNQLLARALDRMERNMTLAAKVRHRATLGEEESIGEGEYWQQGVGNHRRSRWQMRARAGDDTLSLVQVFDRRYLWTDRRFGKSRRVTRLDIQRLRRELISRNEEGPATPTIGTPSPEDAALLARGGLSQLLADLQRRYDFSPPRPAVVDRTPTWAVVGQWKPQELAQLWHGAAFDSAAAPLPPFDLHAWPAQIPHHVVVHFGQSDLFAYFIEFRSAADASAATAVNAVTSVPKPLAQYTLFDVQFAAAIDPQMFEFDSRDVDWVDETAEVVAEFLPVAEKLAEDQTAIRHRVVR